MEFTEKELKNEIWKDIVEFKDRYQISTLGRIKSLSRREINYVGTKKTSYRSIPEKIIKVCDNGNGYKNFFVTLNGKRVVRYVHRLVALTFLENTFNKKEVNHKNLDKSDNRLINLEWVTRKENSEHLDAHILRGIKRRVNLKKYEKNPVKLSSFYAMLNVRKMKKEDFKYIRSDEKYCSPKDPKKYCYKYYCLKK